MKTGGTVVTFDGTPGIPGSKRVIVTSDFAWIGNWTTHPLEINNDEFTSAKNPG